MVPQYIHATLVHLIKPSSTGAYVWYSNTLTFFFYFKNLEFSRQDLLCLDLSIGLYLFLFYFFDPSSILMKNALYMPTNPPILESNAHCHASGKLYVCDFSGHWINALEQSTAALGVLSWWQVEKRNHAVADSTIYWMLPLCLIVMMK